MNYIIFFKLSTIIKMIFKKLLAYTQGTEAERLFLRDHPILYSLKPIRILATVNRLLGKMREKHQLNVSSKNQSSPSSFLVLVDIRQYF